MNKKNTKKFLSFAVLGVFALAMVTGAIISHYGQVQQEINVESPIIVTSEPYSINSWAGVGSVEEGDNIEVENIADVDVDVEVVNNAPVGISVSYLSELELTTKDTAGDWSVTEDNKATVRYTIIGDEFNTDVELDAGYILVYAMDKQDRFDPSNYAVVVKVEDVDESLPLINDWNADADPNYCDNNNGFDSYENCVGAKLWIVKESDLGTEVNGAYPLNWESMNTYLYETDLIKYVKGASGVLTIPAESELVITPVYTIASNYIGNAVVTTSINPITA